MPDAYIVPKAVSGKCVYFHTKCIAKNWGVLSLRTTTREKNLVNDSV